MNRKIKKSRTFSKRVIVSISVVVILAAIIAISIHFIKMAPKNEPVKIGDTAPAFSKITVRDEKINLNDYKGRTVILSFFSDTTADDTKSETNFLRSMERQYAAQGLAIIIIGEKTKKNELLNFSYDWNLESVPMISDNSQLATLYGVEVFPTTFIISPQEVVVQRFDGLALSSQLALSLQAVFDETGGQNNGNSMEPPG